MKVDKHMIRLQFEHARDMRPAADGKVIGFAVAGADKIFHWADAEIDGSSVFVKSDEVPDPVAVGYGRAFHPIGNLVNGDGLPAVPFRTDDWQPTNIRSTEARP